MTCESPRSHGHKDHVHTAKSVTGHLRYKVYRTFIETVENCRGFLSDLRTCAPIEVTQILASSCKFLQKFLFFFCRIYLWKMTDSTVDKGDVTSLKDDLTRLKHVRRKENPRKSS